MKYEVGVNVNVPMPKLIGKPFSIVMLRRAVSWSATTGRKAEAEAEADELNERGPY